MKIFLQVLVFLSAFVSASSSWADWSLEAQGLYLNEGQTTASQIKKTDTFGQGAFLVSLTEQFFVGWSYGVYSTDSQSGSIRDQMEIEDTGLMMRWYLDRDRYSSIFLNYNVLSNARHVNGSLEEDLTGTSLLAGLTLAPEVGHQFYMGLQINYYNADFTTKTVSGVKSAASYNKNWLFPSLILVKTF